MKSFNLAEIERVCTIWAKVYDWLTPTYILGNEKRLRAITLAALSLGPSQAVLDIACGTGRNFPLILDRIGPTGRLVGVDYTEAMLSRARRRVE